MYVLPCVSYSVCTGIYILFYSFGDPVRQLNVVEHRTKWHNNCTEFRQQQCLPRLTLVDFSTDTRCNYGEVIKFRKSVLSSDKSVNNPFCTWAIASKMLLLCAQITRRRASQNVTLHLPKGGSQGYREILLERASNAGLSRVCAALGCAAIRQLAAGRAAAGTCCGR